jgi:hypothetical protein
MEAWRVWTRRQKTVILKYCRGKFFHILIPRINHLIKEGLGVEQSSTPLNGSMEGLAEETKICHPKVPQKAVSPALPH